MKERLINNLGLKILAIFLAFFVWLVVVNVSNPEVTRSKEVVLEIENEQVLLSANRTYELSGKNTVTVSYKVRTRDEYKVRATDFRACIDLAELYDVTGSVPVKVEVLNNKEIITDAAARPGVARVVTEDLQRKRFDLKVTVEGDPADEYAVNGVTVTPDYVYVEGPVSQVGLISTVGLEIGVAGATEDVAGKATPKFYNANGNEINLSERVKVDFSEVDFHVNINKVKRLNIDFNVSGKAAPGYQYAGVECATKSIAIIGLKTNLANINTITIPSSVLNIDGATEDKIVQVNLKDYLPGGVDIATSEEPVIDIRLKVELLRTKTFRLQENEIQKTGALSSYDYRLKPKQIEVTMQGLGDDLNSLTAADLGVRLNVSSMGIGTNKGTLTFHNSEVFTVLSYTDFEVEVTEKTVDDNESSTEDSEESSSAHASSGAAESETSREETTENESKPAGVVVQPTTTESTEVYIQ